MREGPVKKPSIHRSRRGATLVETFLALGLLAVVMTGFTILLADYSEKQKAQIVASRLEMVTDAAKRYMLKNGPALLDAMTGSTPIRIPVAKVRSGDPEPIAYNSKLPSLQGGGFLASSFVDTNSYGQSHAFIVRRVAGTNRLEAIVTTKDGRVIPDGVLGQIASTVGQTAAFIPAAPTSGPAGRMSGTAGGWTAEASNWQVGGIGPKTGHAMASIALDDGAVVSDYIHRKYIGIAEANTMRTNFSLGGYAVNDMPSFENGATKVKLDNVAKTIAASGDTDVVNDLSAKSITAATARSPVFTDTESPNPLDPYKMDPKGKSKFFDLASESIDTDMMAYGDSMKAKPSGAGVPFASATRSLGSYLRHDMKIVKNAGSAGSGQETIEAYCPSTHMRVGCAGGRSDPLLDTCDESQCGFIGAMPVDDPVKGQGCQTVIDGQQGTRPVVQAFCLSNIESVQSAGAPAPAPPIENEPTQQCPKWASEGTWPNCRMPPECPPWAPGTYPTCKLPVVGPACPAWAPGVYPNCIVNICPPWQQGDFPYCGTQPVFDLFSVTCTSNAGRTQTIVGEGTDNVVTARAPSNLGTWVMKLGGPYVNCNDMQFSPDGSGLGIFYGHELCRKFMPASASPWEATPLENCSWRKLNFRTLALGSVERRTGRKRTPW
jgi:type II secretory pathway pseudopilin PulG